MTARGTRTPTEIALAERAATVVGRLPGELPAALRSARAGAARRFADLGLPGRQIEEWKFTDLRSRLRPPPASGGTPPAVRPVTDALAPMRSVEADTYRFVDGLLVSRPASEQAGVTVGRLADEMRRTGATGMAALPPTVDTGAASLVALNTALAEDGIIIEIAAGAMLDLPLHISFSGGGDTAVRNRIVIGSGAKATIIESHDIDGLRPGPATAVASLDIRDGATIEHVKIMHVAAGAALVASAVSTLGANAVLRPVVLMLGHGLARYQPIVTCAGTEASFDLGAAMLASKGAHLDLTLVFDHAVPSCVSRELVKAVIGEEARAVFQGKVIVRPDAQKSDGKQMAQALMLSPSAEFDSKPELEIYADDVVCGHGSTATEIDRDLLFYCRSRGIPEPEARAMLIESFVGEALERIETATVRDAVAAIGNGWLRSHM